MIHMHRKIGLLLSTAATLTMLGANVAHAVCAAPATQLNSSGGPNSLSTALSGNTVCVGSSGNWANQEWHSGSGSGPLVDWKKGNDPVDPTKQIGTWAISGSGPSTIVTYSYTGGSSFSFTVWRQTTGTLDFCTGSTPVVSGAKVQAGQGPCS
jgi:hypothetical protein